MHRMIEAITGTMFSGKSAELIRRLKRVEIAGRTFIAFVPEIDTRRGTSINTNDGQHVVAHEVPIERPEKAIEILEREEGKKGKRFDLVAIDEVQFFPANSGIVEVVRFLARSGYRVIVSGLDMDFRGEPFGATPALLAIANNLLKLSAVCSSCGDNAYLPQRLVNGRPVSYTAEQILVGGQESYEARCESCHELPGRPRAVTWSFVNKKSAE